MQGKSSKFTAKSVTDMEQESLIWQSMGVGACIRIMLSHKLTSDYGLAVIDSTTGLNDQIQK